MNKKLWIIITILIILLGIFLILFKVNKKEKVTSKNITTNVLAKEKNKLTVQDKNNVIYTFDMDSDDVEVGNKVVVEYTGLLSRGINKQTCKVIDYEKTEEVFDENGIPDSYLDNGIFKDYYILAYNKLKTLSLDEKIAQVLLVRYPDSNQKEQLRKHQFAGYVFFEKDFKDKSETEVKQMMKDLQEVSNIPILTAVDEEGGKVVRVSSNNQLVSEKYKSPSDLYQAGGFDKIKEDTISKSNTLNNLGINLNLAPVVDVATSSTSYMYDRTLKEDTEKTKEYAKTVIESSKGLGVSYTLKHFPGYGDNADTHTGTVSDTRSYDDIVKNDLPPFKEGINVGAEAVLVSHNTVDAIDNSNPASLSSSVHNLLRNDLGFTGIIMTDDLDMGATKNIAGKTTKALLAGNDLVITTDYLESINEIKDALNNNTISEELINKLAFRVIAWKYYKSMMFDIHK